MVKELLSCMHSERSTRQRGLFQAFGSRGWKLEQPAADKRDSACCWMGPGHRVLTVNTSESPIQQAKRKRQVPRPLFQRALVGLVTCVTWKRDYIPKLSVMPATLITPIAARFQSMVLTWKTNSTMKITIKGIRRKRVNLVSVFGLSIVS